MNEEAIKRAEAGASRQGKGEYLKYLRGQSVTPMDSLRAKCFECTNGYADGARDCEVPLCPLYQFMPFRKGGPAKTRVSTLTEAQKKAMGERLRAARQNAPKKS